MRAGISKVGRIFIVVAGLATTAQGAESWDAIYMGAVKVGHNHVQFNAIKDGQGRPVKDDNGTELYRVQVNTVLSLKRGRDRTETEMRFGTIETPDGRVLSLDVRAQTGGMEQRTHGIAKNGKMKLSFEIGRSKQEKVLDWPDTVRGPYAAEQSLARQPIKPGETRELIMFVPVLNVLCKTQLRAIEKEKLTLGDNTSRELLRVEQTASGDDGKALPEMEMTLWIDESGQVLKGYNSIGGGMTYYRTTRAGALAPNGDYDQLTSSIIKLDRTISNPAGSRSATYRIQVGSGDIADIFPNDQRQVLTRTSDHSGTLQVRSEGAATPGPAPGPEFLRANPLVNSDDPLIRQLARTATAGKTGPWEKAVAIQDWVWKNLKKKDFGTVYISAREVAQRLEGDCTEHGVLTAAMCRAVGVPSRVVAGLVYAPYLGGFGAHMWNEVYVDGRWVALDAALNQNQVDATHLKLSDHGLDGISPYEMMSPVARLLMGTTSIKVVEVQ